MTNANQFSLNSIKTYSECYRLEGDEFPTQQAMAAHKGKVGPPSGLPPSILAYQTEAQCSKWLY